ncbi:hypothetical protein VCRA2110O2_30042 [Vibrio crassostreae]|nr:hypothetical protein VCRA2110O2_30042 [Vibrio crassostreae]
MARAQTWLLLIRSSIHRFIEGKVYKNLGCYPNGDIEIELSDLEVGVTIRATSDEYYLFSEYQDQLEQCNAQYGSK